MPQVTANRTDSAHAATGQSAPSPHEAELPLADRMFKLALVQCAPVLGDRAKNFAMHLAKIEQARAAGADLILFPELSLTGYFLRDMVPDVALRPSAPEIEQLLSAGNVCFNLSHAAFAMGFAASWTNKWYGFDTEAQTMLGARGGERFVGFIHIGTPTTVIEDRDRPNLEKIVTRWSE